MLKYPSYLNLTKQAWQKRINQAYAMLKKCSVCPRKCGVDRFRGELGFCKTGIEIKISSYFPHFGEESCLVGTHGSGTIFITHCNMVCVYCQNYDVSQLSIGREVSVEEVAEMALELQRLGCHNINFVTPSHIIPQIIKILSLAAEKGLKVPIVYNSNGYDGIESLKLLNGIIDIYMPDIKYADNKNALKYSMTPNYVENCKKAIKEMHRQVGDLVLKAPEGIAVKGLLVRHLVLPGDLAGTSKCLEFLAKEISPNTFINLMNQYRPEFKASNYPPLDRILNLQEYKSARQFAEKIGLKRIYPFRSVYHN